MLAHPSSCPGSSYQGAPSRSLAEDPMAVAPSPPSWLSPTARGSHDAIACGVCSYSVDDDGSGRAQHQRCHDENGGQDDQDDDPDIQDVLGEVGRTREVREVHPARERWRGGGAALSLPPIARVPPQSPAALSRDTPVARSSFHLGLLREPLIKAPSIIPTGFIECFEGSG